MAARTIGLAHAVMVRPGTFVASFQMRACSASVTLNAMILVNGTFLLRTFNGCGLTVAPLICKRL